jgi:hypothetical protein
MRAFFRNLAVAAALLAAVYPVWAGKPLEENPDAPVLTADDHGALHLLPENATITGKSIRLGSHDGLSFLGNWRDPADTITWKIRVPNDGRYQVRMETSAQNEGSVIIVRCGGKLALSVPVGETPHDFKTSRVGQITLNASKEVTFTLKAVVDGWQPVHVRRVDLIPMP